jgi:hypothetical protein
VNGTTPAEVDVRALEARLRAAEDRLALLDLEGAYGYLYDSRQGRLWAALFTPDGSYQGRQLEGMAPQNLVQGREDLQRFCEQEPLSGMHFMHAPHITVQGDEGTGRVHFQFQASGVDEWGRTSSRAVSGYYDVRYVRTAEGWRIRRRVTTYLEAAHRTTYRYEPTPADLDPETVGDAVSYQDSRA